MVEVFLERWSDRSRQHGHVCICSLGTPEQDTVCGQGDFRSKMSPPSGWSRSRFQAEIESPTFPPPSPHSNPCQQFTPSPSPYTPGGRKWTRKPKSSTGVTKKMTTRHTTPADPVKISVNLVTMLTRIAMIPCLWAGTRMISAQSTLTSLVHTRKSPNPPKFLATATGTITGSLHTVALDSPLTFLLHIRLTSTQN